LFGHVAGMEANNVQNSRVEFPDLNNQS
jgi:hypothetical protein